MALTLKEYAALHPMPEPEQVRRDQAAAAEAAQRQQSDREAVEQLQESIIHQLEQGNAPQYPLYAAVKVIGILTHDTAWTDAAQSMLDSVYDDLAQQSLLTDNAAIAAHRLEERQAEYIGKTRRQLQRSLTSYRKLEKALADALHALDELEPEAEPDQPQADN